MDGYINAEECAKYLGYSVGTIRNMTSEHKLPHYKIGRKVVYKKTELQEWIKQFKVATDADIAGRV